MHPAHIRLLLICSAFAFCHAHARDNSQAAAPVSVNPPGPPPVVPLVPEPLPSHLLFVLETYILPQGELDELHSEVLESQAFYDRIRKLVDDGKAALDSLMALPTRSGQRATNESVDEVIYPTEFNPPVPAREYSYPTAFEMRPAGHRMEIDPVLCPDETHVDINIAPESVRLAGFVVQKSDETATGQVQPLFTNRILRNATTCSMNVPALLGTSSSPKGTGVPSADGDGSVAVTFITPRLSSSEDVMPLSNPPPNEGTGNLRMVFRFYSLPRGTARDLLAKYTDADKLHAAVRALPPADWKLERLITMETRSGQRATTEEIGEYTYGTEMEPPHPPRIRGKKPDATPPAAPTTKTEGQSAKTPPPAEEPVYAGKKALPSSFTAFEMRPVGWRIELDPVIGPDGSTVDLNVVPEHTEYRGNLQGHAMLSRYPQQPVFATQKITTAVTTTVGRQCFLGTMNVPHDTGVNDRKDDGRAWFAFVVVTLQ